MVGRSKKDRSWYDLKRSHKRELRSRERRRAGRESADGQGDAFRSGAVAWPAEAWMVVGLVGANCRIAQGKRRLACSVPDDALPLVEPTACSLRAIRKFAATFCFSCLAHYFPPHFLSF